MFQDVRKQHGGLDALINNAGIASMNPVALTPVDSVRRMLDTNFLGVFLCTHAALRLLRSSKAGRIVNLTTIAVPLRLEGRSDLRRDQERGRNVHAGDGEGSGAPGASPATPSARRRSRPR